MKGDETPTHFLETLWGKLQAQATSDHMKAGTGNQSSEKLKHSQAAATDNQSSHQENHTQPVQGAAAKDMEAQETNNNSLGDDQPIIT